MLASVQRPEGALLLGPVMESGLPAAYLGLGAAACRIEMTREMAVRLRISGRVQGVAYRAWAERQASLLALSGWVRNRRDGSVEAVISGPEGAVREMIARCRRGPSLARVAAITEEVETGPVAPGFRQAPTV